LGRRIVHLDAERGETETPKITGALVTSSARVASPTAQLTTAESAVITPRSCVLRV
jgi:hypothetical protein